MAENVNILLAKTNAESIMNAYNQRQAKLAEIAAKKELVSMSTAIDTAAGKGNGKLVYRLSGSITRLTGSLWLAQSQSSKQTLLLLVMK